MARDSSSLQEAVGHGQALGGQPGAVPDVADGRGHPAAGDAADQVERVDVTGPGLLLGGERDQRALGVGVEVEQRGGQAGAGHAVEQAVVVLHQDADPATGQAVEHPHLPQRPLAVELGGQQHAGHLADLAGAAGARHPEATDVVADVEVRVVDPARPVQAQGSRGELPGELGGVADPLGHRLHDVLVGQSAGAGLEDRQAADVLVPRRGLHREEQRVGAAQALHGGVTFRRQPSESDRY